jgi:hypothetical protein
MILTTHALVGAAVGKYVQNPIALTAILIPLHYALDIFRHGEYLNKKSTFKNTWWKVALDLVAGISIIITAATWQKTSLQILFSMLAGAFVSMFPDLLTVLYWKLHFKFLGKIYHFHQFVHHRFKDGSPEREWTIRNATNDIFFSIIALALLLL